MISQRIKAFINKILFTSFVLSLSTSLAFSQAAILLQGVTQFLDNNGDPLTGGFVYTYVPPNPSAGLKTTWKDPTALTPNTNPIVLDSAGRAVIFGEGTYYEVVQDVNSNLIWEGLTTPGAASSTGNIGDGLLVGSILPWSGVAAPAQYMFAAGQAVNRVTYSALYTATTLTASVVCSSGNATISGLTDTTNIPIGSTVEIPCVSGGTATVSTKTSSTVTLNTTANENATVTAIFYPFGNGDGSTTFNLPDLRGNTMYGNNNMGGTAGSRLNSTYALTNPNALGAVVGGQSETLLDAQLPTTTITPTVASASVNFAGVPVNAQTQNNVAITGASHQFSQTGASPAIVDNPGVTVTMNSFTFGSSAAHTIVTPGITINYVIKVTPDINGSSVSGVASLGGMTGVIACGAGILCTGNIISSTGIVSNPLILNSTFVINAQSSVSSDVTLEYNNFPDLIIDHSNGQQVNVGVTTFHNANFQSVFNTYSDDTTYGANDNVGTFARTSSTAGGTASFGAYVNIVHASGANPSQPSLLSWASRGTITAPSAIQAGDQTLVVDPHAYNGSAWIDQASGFNLPSCHTWSGSNNDAMIQFFTTPQNTLSGRVNSWTMNCDGSLTSNGNSQTGAGTIASVESFAFHNAIGVGSLDGLVAQNTTAAANGAQQFSPCVRLSGNGWKTTSTAASEDIDWCIQNQTVQGSAAPTSLLSFLVQVNGAGYNNEATLSSAGAFTVTSLALGGCGIGSDALCASGTTELTSASAVALAVGPNGATNPAFKVDASVASLVAGLRVKGDVTGGTVTITAIDSGSNTNLAINAKGSGTIGIGGGSTGAVTIMPPLTVSASIGLSAVAWSATAPTISSGFCATSPSISANNGIAAFDINVGTSCSGSTGTLGMPTATTGWVCNFANVTNPATNAVSQTGGSASTVTLTNYVRITGVAGNFTASDHIRAECVGY